MNHDCFISHAGEDKDAVARPIADGLRQAGFMVWFDEYTLSLGDSLAGSIDRGLADSHFGVIIISPDFIRKAWPKREFRAFLTRETFENRKMLFPIWVNVTADDIRRFSPFLADTIALNVSHGIESIVEALSRAFMLPIKVDKEGSTNPASPEVLAGELARTTYFILALQDLYRLAALFPEVCKDDPLKHVRDQLLAELMKLKYTSSFPDVFRVLPDDMQEVSPSSESLAMALGCALFHCQGGQEVIGGSVHLITPFMRSRTTGLGLWLPEEDRRPLRTILNFKIEHCRIPRPEGYPEYSSPRRLVGLAGFYWGLLVSIVEVQSAAEVGWQPHPLHTLIRGLRDRSWECLSDLDASETGRATLGIDTLVDALLGGEPDALSVDEWRNDQIAQVQEALDRLRATYQASDPVLLEPEQLFAGVVEAAVVNWKRQTKEEFRKMLRSVAKATGLEPAIPLWAEKPAGCSDDPERS